MGLVAHQVEQRGYRLEVTNPRSPAYWLQKMFGGGSTASGISMNPARAMQIAAVFSAIRILAEDVGGLPLFTYKRLIGADGQPMGKARAPMHPLYRLLHDSPNPEMTAMSFKQALQGHKSGWGNGYAEIQWSQNMYPLALWPLRPDRMRVMRSDGTTMVDESTQAGSTAGELVYDYTLPNGQRKIFARDNIFHLRGFSFDGIVGYSTLSQARESMALAAAAEEFGSRFFANGAIPGIVIKHPKSLSDIAKGNIRDGWDNRQQGLTNAQRTAILDEGMGIEKIGIPPEDAQFLQTREFQITEIARWFRLPPHMLAQLDKSNFAVVDAQGQDYVTYSLRSHLIAWEQQGTKDLMPVADQATYYIEHLVDAFLQGDIKTRFDAYGVALDKGIFVMDEIRDMENRNPYPDGLGALPMIPLNSVPASAFDENGMTQDQRLKAVALLTKAGFDPAAALKALNLPAITHTGLVPTTVQVGDPDS
jgi:HK97 family phage portal protein